MTIRRLVDEAEVSDAFFNDLLTEQLPFDWQDGTQEELESALLVAARRFVEREKIISVNSRYTPEWFVRDYLARL